MTLRIRALLGPAALLAAAATTTASAGPAGTASALPCRAASAAADARPLPYGFVERGRAGAEVRVASRRGGEVVRLRMTGASRRAVRATGRGGVRALRVRVGRGQAVRFTGAERRNAHGRLELRLRAAVVDGAGRTVRVHRVVVAARATPACRAR
jgi:hypothetical protein